MEEINHEDDSLFNELVEISAEIDRDIEIQRITDSSMIELKSDEMFPIYNEYYDSSMLESLHEKGSNRPKIKDPKGGLTAAGRAYFKKKEGANLKPGVMGEADTPEKLRRKGSFLTRFFTNPAGPMKDEKGRATRLALSASAWGEPVPKNAEDAAKLAAKGRRMLERYSKMKKKSEDSSILSIKTFNPTHSEANTEVYDFTEKPLNSQITQRAKLRKAIAKTSAIEKGDKVIPEDEEKIKRMITASIDFAKDKERYKK